jgi:hypothetical protein
MVDFISDPDFSWLFDGDFDLGSTLQDYFTAAISQQNESCSSSSGSFGVLSAMSHFN